MPSQTISRRRGLGSAPNKLCGGTKLALFLRRFFPHVLTHSFKCSFLDRSSQTPLSYIGEAPQEPEVLEGECCSHMCSYCLRLWTKYCSLWCQLRANCFISVHTSLCPDSEKFEAQLEKEEEWKKRASCVLVVGRYALHWRDCN